MYLQTERMVMKTIPGQQRNTYYFVIVTFQQQVKTTFLLCWPLMISKYFRSTN